MSETRVAEILLVEDSDTDILLMREAMKESGFGNRLHAVRDGVEALEFLRNEGTFHDAPAPDLILLDLNMPRKDGREVLTELKSDDDLKSIPTVVLTTSTDVGDIRYAYDSHANSFVRKPLDIKGYFEVVRSIEEFWIKIATPPSEADV